MGFPIRTSRDQRVLSPPPGLSQSATSFIASCCQGIHQTPLSRLIRSRRRRALLCDGGSNRQPIPSPDRKSSTRRRPLGRKRHGCEVRTIRVRPDSQPSRSVCFRLGKTVFGCPTALRCLRTSPRNRRRGAHRPFPTRSGPKTSRVFALFTMSDQVVAAISRSDRKAHHGMSLPIGSPELRS